MWHNLCMNSGRQLTYRSLALHKIQAASPHRFYTRVEKTLSSSHIIFSIDTLFLECQTIAPEREKQVQGVPTMYVQNVSSQQYHYIYDFVFLSFIIRKSILSTMRESPLCAPSTTSATKAASIGSLLVVWSWPEAQVCQ